MVLLHDSKIDYYFLRKLIGWSQTYLGLNVLMQVIKTNVSIGQLMSLIGVDFFLFFSSIDWHKISIGDFTQDALEHARGTYRRGNAYV